MGQELTTQPTIREQIQKGCLMRITKQTYLDVWRELPITAAMVVAEVQNMKTPEISTINRGEATVEPAIELYEFVILGLLEFYGCEWSKEQIRESAEGLFREYYWLQIAELKHLVVKIKMSDMRTLEGKPFRVYGKFNPSMLSECFKVYSNESLVERGYAGERRANEERYNERWNSHDERLKKDSEAYTMNGLITQEKSKLKPNEKVD